MKKKHVFIFLFAAYVMPVLSQQSKIRYEVETQATGTTNNVVPFWMRSNQFGSIPSNGASGSFIGRAYRDYDTTKSGLFDWALGFEGRANAGKASKLLLIEGYGKVKAGIFQVKVGRSKDVMGFNGDSLLTSGNWSVSGNSLGIPKVEISIPDFYRIPLLDGLFSFKGTFAHGWVGKQELRSKLWIGQDSIKDHAPINTYFHSKSLYVRLGKADWKLNLTAGVNHQVYWGNEKDIYGESYDISNFRNFLYVLTGSTFDNGKVPGSKVGNHLGSVDVAASYKWGDVNLIGYRQFFYDAGALGHLANLKDGLTGLTLVNEKRTSNLIDWRKILIELLYSKNQAGELSSKITPSGDEDYYNNHIYRKGWTYKDQNIGSPFLTSRNGNIRGDLIMDPNNYFINNRVIAVHLGAELGIQKWTQVVKLSFSNNYGTYNTSAIGSSIGRRRDPPRYGIFKTVKQMSLYTEGSKHLRGSMRIGYSAAVDHGDLLKNSLGFSVRVSKQF